MAAITEVFYHVDTILGEEVHEEIGRKYLVLHVMGAVLDDEVVLAVVHPRAIEERKRPHEAVGVALVRTGANNALRLEQTERVEVQPINRGVREEIPPHFQASAPVDTYFQDTLRRELLILH